MRSWSGNLAWMMGGGLVVFITWLAVDMNQRFGTRPPLAADLSGGTWEQVSEAFDERIAAAFPPGTPSEDVVRELARQGFHATWDSTEHVKVAVIDVPELVCKFTYIVAWQVDDAGKLLDSRGSVQSACL